MKVGVTGHQERKGIDWLWVKHKLIAALEKQDHLEGYSSLAVGSDQIFAKCVIGQGGVSVAVIPLKSYQECFDKIQISAYFDLLKQSKIVDLDYIGSNEQAFLNAGKWIVEHVDLMIAIWDGEPAEGKGGTADIVAYTLSIGKPVHHIDPIRRTIYNI